jgi:hypothetical protein
MPQKRAAMSGQAIDVRRDHLRMAVAAELRAEIIDRDEQDVERFAGTAGGGEAGQGC